MNTDKYELIKRCAIRFNSAQLALEALQMQNCPSDPKEREESMIAYHLAKAEAHEAKAALDAAVVS